MKDTKKSPSLRGLQNQIDAYFQQDLELMSMIKNQIDMEKDEDTKKLLIQTVNAFVWQKLWNAMLAFGKTACPAQLHKNLKQALLENEPTPAPQENLPKDSNTPEPSLAPSSSSPDAA